MTMGTRMKINYKFSFHRKTKTYTSQGNLQGIRKKKNGARNKFSLFSPLVREGTLLRNQDDVCRRPGKNCRHESFNKFHFSIEQLNLSLLLQLKPFRLLQPSRFVTIVVDPRNEVTHDRFQFVMRLFRDDETVPQMDDFDLFPSLYKQKNVSQ
jgi:hypothetical protein